MKYLPITLIVTLAASMAYALVFAPSIGAIIGKAPLHTEEDRKDGLYMSVVKTAVHFPITALVLTVALLSGGMYAYVKYGNGVEFFPTVEPDYGLLYVHARGNLSLAEMDIATREAERRILGWPGIKSVYTRVGKTRGGQDIPEDVVGVINYEFIDWRERKSAHDILDDLRVAMAGIPGVDVEVRVPDAGPPTGKPVQVQLSAVDPTGLNDYAKQVAAAVAKVPGVIDLPTACRLRVSTGRLRSIVRRPRNMASRPWRWARSCSSSPRVSSSPTIVPPGPTTRLISACACRKIGAHSPHSTNCVSRPLTARCRSPISSPASRSRQSAS
jgi:multidrug efflux pump subunit AcrB